MKIKLLPTIIAAGLFTSSVVLAADYQAELSGNYADVDVSGADVYGVSVEGKYYFAPVNTANNPLAEAAFIEKSSSVYLAFDNFEIKTNGDRQDIYARTIGVDFYVPNSFLYLGAGVSESKFSGTPVSTDWDSQWFLKAGVAPIKGLLVWSEFVEDVDVSEAWNLNGKYVFPLSGEQSLNLEASYEKSKIDFADQTITMAADYYIDRNLSLGGGFVNTSYVNSDSENDYFVRARNFFTDKANLELTYVDGESENTFMLGGTLRF